MPPDSDVRSSIQSTALTPASATCSSGFCLSAWPGREGAAWKRFGTGGRGSLGICWLLLRGGEATRVDVLADAVQRLAGVAVAGEARELRVDRVARADLDLAVAHAGVEVVERPDRRATGDAAREVVDAAVTRTDEAVGGRRPADGAAEVHAAAGERDERLDRQLRAVDLLVVRPDVRGGLADLADAERVADDA